MIAPTPKISRTYLRFCIPYLNEGMLNHLFALIPAVFIQGSIIVKNCKVTWMSTRIDDNLYAFLTRQ